MIPAQTLIDKVRAYNPGTDARLLQRAYDYGRDAHDGQMRHSGEPYFSHPVEVAWQLAEQRLDDSTLVTALLHDTIEDTEATFTEVADLFGEEVAKLVDGVTKLTNLQLTSSESRQAEDFRKLFMAMSEDLRVILVKLADRLHNMRTISAMRPEKQVKKAHETMEIYAPLAGRMGMQWMRDELEDLAFEVLNPDARRSIIKRFAVLRKDSGGVIERITSDIEWELGKAGIAAEVHGRAKRPYSIWRKAEEKGVGFSRLSDIYGFRVITDNEEDCYRVLGAIHQRWRAVPGRFKDYISQPKSNGYRSIHTTVSGRDGKRVEVQVRTNKMHEVAERGVAAHWSYKDGQRSENAFAVDPAKWLAALSAGLVHAEDDDEFLEHVKLEMYADQVFCFTPKGEVVKLPRGATPIDFGFAIHTRLGQRCVGAKVDGMRVPLWTRLKNGQSVDVITAEGQRPHATWLDMAITGRAKQAIRRSLREDDRGRFVKLGRELVRVAFEHIGKKATDKVLANAATIEGLASAEALLAQVGATTLSASDVVGLIYPDLARTAVPADVDPEHAVIGLDEGVHLRRGRCCQPVPGERIIGITNGNAGVIAHKADCPVLSAFEDQGGRWRDLRWAPGNHAATHAVTLDLAISHATGVLGRICTLIGEANANISDLRFTDQKPDFYRLLIDVEVRDSEHLHAVITVLDADSDVAALVRHREESPKPAVEV